MPAIEYLRENWPRDAILMALCATQGDENLHRPITNQITNRPPDAIRPHKTSHAPPAREKIVGMSFDPDQYGSAVAAILHLDGDGQRPMPLVTAGAGSDEARAMIRQAGAHQLFPKSRAPEAAMAGLYLYFDCWADAHETAQDIASPEGSYWHAIVHRQEPDAGNSSYWFRQVGSHAIFPALRDAAAGIGLAVGPRWKPEAFIEFCERARQNPGSELERQALEVQRAEWQLLFDYCAQ